MNSNHFHPNLNHQHHHQPQSFKTQNRWGLFPEAVFDSNHQFNLHSSSKQYRSSLLRTYLPGRSHSASPTFFFPISTSYSSNPLPFSHRLDSYPHPVYRLLFSWQSTWISKRGDSFHITISSLLWLFISPELMTIADLQTNQTCTV